MTRRHDVINRLSAYPLSAHCFSRYVPWLMDRETGSWATYDVLRALCEGDDERLRLVEERLNEARTALDLSAEEFAKTFGFMDDLLSEDPEKLHDVLAEPLFVLDLVRSGFSSVRKLPRFIKHGGRKIRNADFVALRDQTRFAIELKSIRMENKPPPVVGQLLGDSAKPSWWRQMFHSNAVMKIEDKNRGAIEQLANAKTHYECAKTMLGLYTRRLGPSSLMTSEDYIEELENLLERYVEVDHFACKDYFGDFAVAPAL